KFPAAQIALWGYLLLASVQLYFFVYLKRLTEMLRVEDDTVWGFPWIGMDLSAAARVILFATIVILPLCAVASLVQKDLSVLSDALERGRGETARAVGGVVVFLPVLVLSILCWSYRPRPAPP